MFLMLIIIVWFNNAILKALRTCGPATDKLHPAKKRAFLTVRAIAIFALMCYIPVGGLLSYTIITGLKTICLMPSCHHIPGIGCSCCASHIWPVSHREAALPNHHRLHKTLAACGSGVSNRKVAGSISCDCFSYNIRISCRPIARGPKRPNGKRA